MKPKAFSATSLESLETGILEYKNQGHLATLAIVFCAINFNIEEIRQTFRNHDIDVFGASSAGEITNGNISQHSISVLLLDIDPDSYRTGIFDRLGKSSFDAGKEAGNWACQVFEDPAMLVTSSGFDADGDEIVSGIKSGADGQFPVFGGCAGNDLQPIHDTLAFGSRETVTHGIASIAFDQKKIRLAGLTLCGWKGVGTSKVITKSSGNVVYQIDNRPALEFYRKYLNVNNNEDISRSNETGLLVERPDGSSVMRAAIVINTDDSVAYAGSMPEGAKIRFCTSPGLEVTWQTIDQLKKFYKDNPEADAAILFSCISRLQVMGPMIDEETQAIAGIWKVPYNGFFTFGEIGPGNTGMCDFHNFSLSLVLLKEK